MKNLFILLLSVLFIGMGNLAYSDVQNDNIDSQNENSEQTTNIYLSKKYKKPGRADKDAIIKNKLFSITIPKELKGLYEVKVNRDRICVYHKASKNTGFGGFAFGIKAYKNPADHATLPGSKKIGELTDKRGQIYDMVIKYPTDVQYDYTKNPEAPESYRILYNLGENISINGIKGSVFFKDQGMKGEDLYRDILRKHAVAIRQKWDSSKLESEDMSYMYNVLKSSGNVFDKVGYAYYDINKDGIDELLIGEIAEGDWKGIIYDIYTMVNRRPVHVVSGGSRDRYFVCDDAFICREYSSGAKESGTIVYILLENSTELYPQVSFKYDGYNDNQSPWFLSYGSEFNEDKWENVTQEAFDDRKSTFDKYERFDFIPLGSADISY